MDTLFQQRIEELIQAGRFLSERGLVPATSGNLSARLNDEAVAITVSGKHKGQLQSDDIMQVNMQGDPLGDDAKRPSAETLLHLQLYQRLPAVNFVLHPHSVNATVLSMRLQQHLQLSGYEILKAFTGINTHATTVTIPTFDNDQDMQRLASDIEPYIDPNKRLYAYLIRGHGYYCWGASLEEVLRYIETLEFLFECELRAKR